MITFTVTHNTLRDGNFPKEKVESCDIEVTIQRESTFKEIVTISFDEEKLPKEDNPLQLIYMLGRMIQMHIVNTQY